MTFRVKKGGVCVSGGSCLYTGRGEPYPILAVNEMADSVAEETPVELRFNASWLRAVDRCAEKLHYTRERFILTACQELIEQIDPRELERIYQERLQEHPEEMVWAETGAKLAGMVLPQEEW